MGTGRWVKRPSGDHGESSRLPVVFAFPAQGPARAIYIRFVRRISHINGGREECLNESFS